MELRSDKEVSGLSEYRDIFGRKTYRLGKFFVTDGHNGKWYIKKQEPWYVTDAHIMVEGEFLWFKVEPFDSYIKAVKFLKKHVEELL